MKIMLTAYKPFNIAQIKTLKKMGLKTENEAGQKHIMGEGDSVLREKISKLPFIKYAEEETPDMICYSRNSRGTI
ncbi:MAG: hypothetical protein HY094_03910 [Candidatus Melainabacteria bacterium]|nr:hypothetical protein [Candidatus Melainabacteria bacterium]